jgi:peptidoglycan/xylan/chitin deacetylase (PgdA/CDA1 family)
MYHHLMWDKALSDHANNNMTIEYMQFEEQMRYLKDNKWKTISMQQLDDWLNLQNNLPEKVVAITFDDGITSTVDLAYPFKRYELSGDFLRHHREDQAICYIDRKRFAIC